MDEEAGFLVLGGELLFIARGVGQIKTAALADAVIVIVEARDDVLDVILNGLLAKGEKR